MNGEERLKQIKTVLSRLVDEVEGSFVIFENPETGKLVQFVFIGEALVCNVPFVELSREEDNEVRLLLGDKATIAVEAGVLVARQKRFEVNEIDEAVELTEKIFIYVFKLSKSYRIIWRT